MNEKWLKIALGVTSVGWVTQSIAGLVVLRHYEKKEAKWDAVMKAGLYLVTILEREDVNLTEFDALALEAIRPNPEDKK